MPEYEVKIKKGNLAIGDLVVTDEGVVAELIGMPDHQNVAWVQETDIQLAEVPKDTPRAFRLLDTVAE